MFSSLNFFSGQTIGTEDAAKQRKQKLKRIRLKTISSENNDVYLKKKRRKSLYARAQLVHPT